MTLPLRRTRCSRRNLSILSADVKFISRDTDRHFRILFGTWAKILHIVIIHLKNQMHTILLGVANRLFRDKGNKSS